MSERVFKAGAATSNITPPLGTSLNGGMQDRLAEHIHDELHARALVLDDGERRLGIVVCDSCMIPRKLLDLAKNLAHGFTSIPLDQMLISATHTHSAPTVAGVFQSEPDSDYMHFLFARIGDAIRRAANNLAPAQIGWATASEPSQVFNRRWKMKPGIPLVDPFGRPDQVKMNPPRASADLDEPAGPTDPEICLLAVRGKDDRPIAVLANYSLHYVGDAPAAHVTADYFGAFADRLQQMLDADRLDPPFVGIMSNGTSGNINNIDFRHAAEQQPPFSQIRRVATLVASAAKSAYERIEWKDWVPLAAKQTRLRLGRKPTPKEDIDRAKFILSQAKNGVLESVEQIYARETVLLADYPPVVDTLVQAFRIGELGIAASPCETFVETGLAIKAESPLKPTFTISLANDYCGYLPTAEHHKLGGYETWRARSSFLNEESEAMIRGKLLELLKDLATQ
jgi:neutral ceramidase